VENNGTIEVAIIDSGTCVSSLVQVTDDRAREDAEEFSRNYARGTARPAKKATPGRPVSTGAENEGVIVFVGAVREPPFHGDHDRWHCAHARINAWSGGRCEAGEGGSRTAPTNRH
jgi:hypothetical protein